MALRVLLADESTTIKKVMQLALQDFAVEVKAVQSGLDVLEVARSFQPDIVFADVLLPKRNGYDVVGDLKKDGQLQAIPVVMMWSSFMDLDEKAYLNARANGKLEKPFDVENLRSLILELVPKTQTQRLAHFLRFPASFSEPLEAEETKKKEVSAQAPAPTFADPNGSIHLPSIPPTDDSAAERRPLVTKGAQVGVGISLGTDSDEKSESNWSIDSFEDLKGLAEETLQKAESAAALADSDADNDEDEPVRIAKLGSPRTAVAPDKNQDQKPEKKAEQSVRSASTSSEVKADESGDPWAHQDLARFKLDIPQADIESDEISIVFDMDEVEVPQNQDFLLNSQKGEATQAGLTRTSARIKLPKDLGGEGSSSTSTQIRANQTSTVIQSPRLEEQRPNAPFDGFADASGLELEQAPGPTPPLSPEERYQPVGEIRHADGEMISQFDTSEPTPDLQLDDQGLGTMQFERTSVAPNAHGQVPQLSLDQLEAIVRAQSQDIIEALVRRVVPELATKIIKEELERLIKEAPSGDAG